MTNVIDLADKQATSSTEINENELLYFMNIKPIWDFALPTRQNYLKLSTKEKTQLMEHYCLFMKSNEKEGCKSY